MALLLDEHRINWFKDSHILIKRSVGKCGLHLLTARRGKGLLTRCSKWLDRRDRMSFLPQDGRCSSK